MKLPSREWTGALTISLIAVVLAALDILDGSVHRWWAEHAFTTSLVGGILVLLVTVLVADRVVNARQLRDRSRAIAAQAAIVMTQAARTAQVATAMLEGTGDREAVGDELRSYGTMLLISAPMLIAASLSRAFLEDAQRLAAEVARALHAHRRGTAGETERTLLDDAVQQMRKTSTPLLAILNAEQRVAVTEDPAIPVAREGAA
ncbi:MAG TPA: hypothetical protein VHW96_16935 [Solirubrobacteraceae bacterium]|jgi:hypothetical protein|nr:hypothetical protein [Solirubrobacteraceae bacterium]